MTSAFKRLRFAVMALCALLAGCTSEHLGISLEVGLYVHPSPTVLEGGGMQVKHDVQIHAGPFENDEGYVVTLEQAYITVSGTELVPCDDGPVAKLLYLIFPVRTAHAHSSSTPTQSGVPFVVDAGGAMEEPSLIADLQPPPGEYCSMKVEIGPADPDAEGLPEDPDMVGRSLYLSGYYDDEGEVPFVIESDDTLVVTVVFRNEDGNPAPLVLSEVQAYSVNTGSSYDIWLDGVDFAGMTPADMAAGALRSVGASIHHHVHAIAHSH